jgi:hypothetical protein
MLVDPNRAVAFLVEHEIPGDDAEVLVGFLVCGDVSDFAIDEGRHRVGRVTTGPVPLMLSITTTRADDWQDAATAAGKGNR